MNSRIQWKTFIICLAVPLAVGGISAFLTRNSMNLYEKIVQPPLAPPGWLFPVVWTILYILMGISSYLIATSHSEYKVEALTLYGIQLLLNFIWSPIFFISQNYLLAFIILVILWYVVLRMIQAFTDISSLAGKLQIPYLIWLTFAGYLNLIIYFLNR